MNQNSESLKVTTESEITLLRIELEKRDKRIVELEATLKNIVSSINFQIDRYQLIKSMER